MKVRNTLKKQMSKREMTTRSLVLAAQNKGYNITYSKMNYWLSNKNQPRLTQAFQLCELLGCEIQDFFKARGKKRE